MRAPSADESAASVDKAGDEATSVDEADDESDDGVTEAMKTEQSMSMNQSVDEADD